MLYLRRCTLAGTEYARIEQPADSSSGQKNLIIVHQPDIWIIDVKKDKVSHTVNPGPDFSIHNPILGPDTPIDLSALEYGHEVEFFDHSKTAALGTTEFDGVRCNATKVRSSTCDVVLYTSIKTNKPLRLEVFKDTNLILQVKYLSYDTDLAFDSWLFEPPKNVSMSTDTP